MKMYKKINRIHLIGIGGIGMSGIARLLLTHGYEVTGSDLGDGEQVRQLRELGIRVSHGHHGTNICGADLVVHSSAVKADNPEIVAAGEKQLPVIPRAEMLAELMRLKHGVAVAGAHGKTTTTSMIGTVLMEAGLDPTIVVGGRMDNFGGSNARLGNGEFMVVESDESDGSFSHLSHAIGVVTNLDREHIDFYQNMTSIKRAFLNFLNDTAFYGLNVICGDDPHLKTLLPRVRRRKVTYGQGKNNTYQLVEYTPEPGLTLSRIKVGQDSFTLRLQLPGIHNALNALAAVVVADELEVPRSRTLEALANFKGVQRRFQRRGSKNGVEFIDDYAHHPREIKATLAAARERYPEKKIRVVFQPHRYSRLEDLFDEFARCFQDCDSVAITELYAAGEQSIAGISSESLVDALQKNGHPQALFESTPMAAIHSWLSQSDAGDVIFTLGAGDLPNVYKELF